MSRKGRRSALIGSGKKFGFWSNAPLQATGLEGKSVPWDGSYATVTRVFMNGHHASIVLKLTNGSTITVDFRDIEGQYKKAGLWE